jgi:hypothetical protein
LLQLARNRPELVIVITEQILGGLPIGCGFPKLLLCWLLRISVRKISSLKARIWYYDGRCHGLWRGRSCEANAGALGHTFLKPEIELAMWSQEEGERWCERNRNPSVL